jgi:hypothetical protein
MKYLYVPFIIVLAVVYTSFAPPFLRNDQKIANQKIIFEQKRSPASIEEKDQNVWEKFKSCFRP